MIYATLECAQQYGLPLGVNASFGVHFAQPDTEDKKLRKELTLEVPCFEGTLRKTCCDNQLLSE